MGHRLLDERMLARRSGSDGLRPVLVVTAADVDRIEVNLAQHLLVVGVDGFDAGFLRIRVGRRFDDVAHGNKPHPIRIIEVRGHVGVGYPPSPDQSDS